MNKANILTPVITALDKQGEIDLEGMKKVYDHLIEGGVDGIVLLGSSGEFYAFSDKQKKDLIDMTTSYINKRVKLYVGTGCMTVADTVQLSLYAMEKGADAVMIISPYYFALPIEDIEYYYDLVLSEVKGPVYLYNYPDRTGYDLTPELTLRLKQKHPQIVGYKDTVSEMGHTRALISLVRKDYPQFEVYSGFDENMIHNVMCGGFGCIGGLSNVYPELFARWVKSINEKDVDEMAHIQKKVDKLMDFYEVSQPFMPAMKKAMQLVKGIDIEEYNTKPLLPLNKEQIQKVKDIISAVEQI